MQVQDDETINTKSYGFILFFTFLTILIYLIFSIVQNFTFFQNMQDTLLFSKNYTDAALIPTTMIILQKQIFLSNSSFFEKNDTYFSDLCIN